MGVTIRRPAPTSSGALPLRAVGEPTPERPGPGPMPDALLRAMELTIGRRVEACSPASTARGCSGAERSWRRCARTSRGTTSA